VNRAQLEHLIKAGGSIARSDEIVIVGSQAILASFPDAPAELLRSMEADCFPLDHPERADLIDGSIGELSPFHGTFGYYAHGVGPETALLPSGWRSRLVRMEAPSAGGAVGLCLSPLDIAASKLLAGREKDIAFVRTMLRHGLVEEEPLRALSEELTQELKGLLGERLTVALRHP
jgi:hypothetical protein